MSRSSIVAAVMVLAATSACRPRGEHSAIGLLSPRVVVVYADVSASRDVRRDSVAVQRIANGLRARDRLLVFPTGRGLGELRPVLDTLLPGNVLDGVVQRVGLEAGRNARAARHDRRLLATQVMDALGASLRSNGAPNESHLIESLCHLGEVARALSVDRGSAGALNPVIGILLTDGVEESTLANLSTRVPVGDRARALGLRLRAKEGCSLAVPGLHVQLIGVRHRADSPALVRWWGALLGALGATVRPGDVTPAAILDPLS